MPAYRQFSIDRARAGASNVSVNNPQESAFEKEFGKALAEQYQGFMKADTAAASKLASLQRLESLLRASGSTGPVGPALVSAKSLLKQLGVPVDDTTDFASAARALSNKMSLDARSTADGGGMPGAMSDKDREFLVAMTPGIDKLPNANAILIETQRRLAQREREVARMAREYRSRNKRFDEGFFDLVRKYADDNPLFGDLERLVAPASASGTVTPFGGALPAPNQGGNTVDFNNLPRGR
jgi:hypothetical protein